MIVSGFEFNFNASTARVVVKTDLALTLQVSQKPSGAV
jgi:hypothetical protein